MSASPAIDELAQLRAENARLRAENEALTLSDLRFRRLLESQIIGVLIGSAHGEVLEINRAFERMIGRSSARLDQLEWQKCVPPEELPLHREKAELLWRSGSCPAWETSFVHPDGTRVPVITGATLIDAPHHALSGEGLLGERPVAQGFEGAIRPDEKRTMLMWAIDISERLAVETEWRDSESRMRAIVECLHDGLLITELDDTITYANGRISEMTGYSNAELIGRNAHQFLTDPAEWERCQQRDAERAQGQSGTYEIPIRHKDGSVRWMLINGSPLRDASGAIVGTIGAHFDITERKRDEIERKRFAVRLQNSNRDLEIFAFAVSHDLKEPLRKIETFGGRLQHEESANLSLDGRLYVDRMRDAARRMGGLIDGLLFYSRVATGDATRESVDLNVVAREVLLDLELAIERAGATLEIGELPTLRADATQMRQLLQNLIGNALAYRRPDVPLFVRVSGRESAGDCEIEVADNGRGFEPTQAEAIFEIFRRLDNPRDGGGVGVGLAICRAIVERHGGTLSAQGVAGQGATFRARFPLAMLVNQEASA